jgi:hypothetical protein
MRATGFLGPVVASGLCGPEGCKRADAKCQPASLRPPYISDLSALRSEKFYAGARAPQLGLLPSRATPQPRKLVSVEGGRSGFKEIAAFGFPASGMRDVANKEARKLWSEYNVRFKVFPVLLVAAAW